MKLMIAVVTVVLVSLNSCAEAAVNCYVCTDCPYTSTATQTVSCLSDTCLTTTTNNIVTRGCGFGVSGCSTYYGGYEICHCSGNLCNGNSATGSTTLPVSSTARSETETLKCYYCGNCPDTSANTDTVSCFLKSCSTITINNIVTRGCGFGVSGCSTNGGLEICYCSDNLCNGNSATGSTTLPISSTARSETETIKCYYCGDCPHTSANTDTVSCPLKSCSTATINDIVIRGCGFGVFGCSTYDGVEICYCSGNLCNGNSESAAPTTRTNGIQTTFCLVVVQLVGMAARKWLE